MKKFNFIFIYLLIFSLIILVLNQTDLHHFIKLNFDYLNHIKTNYFLIFILLISLLSILLPFLGFALPTILINGILLEGYLCFFITLFGITIGSFIFYKFFFKKKYNNKIKNYINKVNFFSSKIDTNQFLYFFLLRFLGFGLPFIVHNMLGIFLKIRKTPFFFATLFGVLPLATQSILTDSIFNFYLKSELSFNSFISDYKIMFIIFLLLLIFIVSFFILRNIKINKKNYK